MPDISPREAAIEAVRAADGPAQLGGEAMVEAIERAGLVIARATTPTGPAASGDLNAAGKLRDLVAHINGGLAICTPEQRAAVIHAAELLESRAPTDPVEGGDLAALLNTMPMDVADRVVGDLDDGDNVPMLEDAETLARWMHHAAAVLVGEPGDPRFATPAVPTAATEGDVRWTVSTPEDGGALGMWLVQGWRKGGPGRSDQCVAEVRIGEEQGDDPEDGRLAWHIRELLAATPRPTAEGAAGSGDGAGDLDLVIEAVDRELRQSSAAGRARAAEVAAAALRAHRCAAPTPSTAATDGEGG